MWIASPTLRVIRGLRFRLALSYVVFFSVLLVGLGFVFRATLASIQQKTVEDALEDEWGAVRGYLRIGYQGPDWFFDKDDPDEAFTVHRLMRVFLLTDSAGHPIQYSQIYESLGFDDPREIQQVLKSGSKLIQVRFDKSGAPYVVRSGTFIDADRHKYYLAIGRSTAEYGRVLREITFSYFIRVPFLIVLSGAFGWFLAGRALAPVNSVAAAAHRITHSNLNMQIRLRGAGDELDRLIEAFNRMMERLSLSFSQIRQFSTDVSHELRTPLTIARGQLEVALLTAKTPDQYRDAMVSALEDVERLSSIVKALLLLSQAESGQVLLKKTEFDLAATVHEMVEEFQLPAEAGGLTIEAELPARFPICADHVQVERLISNLVSNAIKYTPSGGRVRIELNSDGGQAILQVSDDGVGIAPDHLPHIFDRFYRVPSEDPEKGLGLGLSFVAWIVKAHGGSINVKSELGKGTMFRVSLPAGECIEEAVRETPALTVSEPLN